MYENDLKPLGLMLSVNICLGGDHVFESNAFIKYRHSESYFQTNSRQTI